MARRMRSCVAEHIGGDWRWKCPYCGYVMWCPSIDQTHWCDAVDRQYMVRKGKAHPLVVRKPGASRD